MCGIAGFISNEGVPGTPVMAMNALLRHRGPDDEGFLLQPAGATRAIPCAGEDTAVSAMERDRHALERVERVAERAVSIALGHRRLSILDLSAAGHQPMSSADGRFWIVYNGEIYNFKELRSRLTERGYRFESHCDTEVLLAAYQEWGEECLPMLKGMWAFAIYDSQSQVLFLARDRFGIKPLYYWFAPDGTFCFASEIKAFSAYPGWTAETNPQRAYDFLVWGLTDHTDETLFRRVYHLPAGCKASVRRDRISAGEDGRLATISRWYALRAAEFDGSFEDAANAFRDRFARSVEDHLQADVPVGSCLSGGLDSSSIVCVVNRILAEKGNGALQKSFSACSHTSRIDERRWVEKVVAATGIDAHYTYPDLERLVGDMTRIAWHQDEPFGSTSILAQWSVFELAAANRVKVMLDGQGADEMLLGYHCFIGSRLATLLRRGRLFELAKESYATRRIHHYSALQLMMRMADVVLPEAIRLPLRRAVGRSTVAPSWLSAANLGARCVEPTAALGLDRRTVRTASMAQLTSSNLQMLLRLEDRSSMAHSIESRVPFLDHELVEFVLGLPDEYKLSRGITKRVQRAAMANLLPPAVRDRTDKIAFQTPEAEWVREDGQRVLRRLGEAAGASDGVLNGHAMDMLREMASGRRAYNSVVWRWISYGEWMRAFSVRSPGSTAGVADQLSHRAPSLRVPSTIRS